MALFTYGSGWLAAALLAATIAAAGLARALHRPLGRIAAGCRWSHLWLGAAAAILGVVHGLGSVTRAPRPLGATIGLWVASAAMFLLIGEAVLGLLLRAPATPQRHRLLRRHLLLMLALVALVILHVVLIASVPW